MMKRKCTRSTAKNKNVELNKQVQNYVPKKSKKVRTSINSLELDNDNINHEVIAEESNMTTGI